MWKMNSHCSLITWNRWFQLNIQSLTESGVGGSQGTPPPVWASPGEQREEKLDEQPSSMRGFTESRSCKRLPFVAFCSKTAEGPSGLTQDRNVFRDTCMFSWALGTTDTDVSAVLSFWKYFIFFSCVYSGESCVWQLFYFLHCLETVRKSGKYLVKWVGRSYSGESGKFNEMQSRNETSFRRCLFYKRMFSF